LKKDADKSSKEADEEALASEINKNEFNIPPEGSEDYINLRKREKRLLW